MTNSIKTILLILSITLSMAFISCKDKGSANPTMKYSDLVGTWTGSGNSFTISSSGYVNFTYGGTTYDNLILDNMDYEFIEGAVSSFNSEYQSYTIPTNNAPRKQRFFTSIVLQVAMLLLENKNILQTVVVGQLKILFR